MPTTSNFGWTTPADTDLVKDGAAAIRTLGNGIDTSLVDLKGGTTGQVLSKASNTDLDFTWTNGGDITEVAAGVGISGGGTSGSVTITNSMATAIDAKGDLIVGTGADTFSRLAVGTTDGHLLQVDSSTATGLKWAASPSPTCVGAVLTKTATQKSISNATATFIDYDDEIFDSDGFHSNSTNNTRITIPTGKGGKYLIFCNINWQTSGTGSRQIYLYKNGTIIYYENGWAPNGGAGTGSALTTVENLVAGDYIEVAVYQDRGSSLNCYFGTTYGTYFGAIYLGA